MIIGIDVGGTSLSAGLVRTDGEVVAVVERPTHADGPGTGVDHVLAAVQELSAEARRRGLPLRGVGVGLPGIVDVDEGMMTGEGGNFVPEFAKVPIAERITEATGLQACVDNDVNALALAEHRYGQGRHTRSLVMLAIGTGVGGAVVLDGQLVRGCSGYAGEFGHVPVMLDGPRCQCGGHGCVAMLVGGTGIAAAARERLGGHPRSMLLDLAGGDDRVVTARTVFDAARAGDPLAAEIVDRACEGLGAVLATILNTFNPELVVVTGGVAESLLPLGGDILRRTGKYALPRVLGDTTIRIEPRSKRQTVQGGAALFLYETERRQAAASRG